MDDLDRAGASWSRTGKRHVAVLHRARGVSAESGIPTFRGLGGLWRGRDPMSLATPQAFAADPALVWEFYNWRRQIVRRRPAAANPAHQALAGLARRVPRLTLITQNVDRLHQRAGSRNVLEIHGNLDDVRCTLLPGHDATLRGRVTCLLCPGAEALWRIGSPRGRLVRRIAAAGNLPGRRHRRPGCRRLPRRGHERSGLPRPPVSSARPPGAGDTSVIEINLEPTPVSGAVDIGLYGKAGEIVPKLIPLHRPEV